MKILNWYSFTQFRVNQQESSTPPLSPGNLCTRIELIGMRLELTSLPLPTIDWPSLASLSPAAAGASEILAPDWQNQLRVIFLARPLDGDRDSLTHTHHRKKQSTLSARSIRTVFSMTPVGWESWWVGWLLKKERIMIVGPFPSI